MEKHRNADGTYDGAGALGELSGLGRPAMVEIWEQVKANHAKLNACPWHEFEAVPMSEAGLKRRYRCIHCGGEIDQHAHHWHEQGRRARP